MDYMSAALVLSASPYVARHVRVVWSSFNLPRTESSPGLWNVETQLYSSAVLFKLSLVYGLS